MPNRLPDSPEKEVDWRTKLIDTFDNARAYALFEEYFVKNYPGPKTIISNPKWHAPKIWRQALFSIGMSLRAIKEETGRYWHECEHRQGLTDDPNYECPECRT